MAIIQLDACFPFNVLEIEKINGVVEALKAFEVGVNAYSLRVHFHEYAFGICQVLSRDSETILLIATILAFLAVPRNRF